MQIKVTKKMTDVLNKAARDNGAEMRFVLEKMTERAYSLYVNTWGVPNHDYDCTTGLCKVIKVLYPDECYALPNYLSTEDLGKLYRHGDDLNTYTARVLDAVEI